MSKLKSQMGESLVELLLSMLIISLGMLMLAGAITTTARLNKNARDSTVNGHSVSSGDTGDNGDNGNANKPLKTLPVTLQVDDSTLSMSLIEKGGVYYYEKTTS